MPTSSANGVELYWAAAGTRGEAVVLVHGSWTDHRSWDRIVPLLATTRRAVTYDRRGHSRSERPPGQGRVHDDAADLAALIEMLDLAPAHVVGNSFGASIALHCAVTRPDLVCSLTLHEPPLYGLLDGLAASALALDVRERHRAVAYLLGQGEMEAGARQFVETLAIGPGGWETLPAERRQTFIHNAPTYLDEERDPQSRVFDLSTLQDLARPTLLTNGDRSDTFFAAIVDILARTIPKAERRTLVGMGHVPQASHPDIYAEVVEGFMREAASR